jgi:hypothetical protein
MNKLLISPDSNGYNIEVPNSFITHKFDEGNSRLRCDIDEQSFILNLKWTVNKSDYNILNNFFITNSAISFLIDLILLDNDIAEYTAIVLPETIKLISQVGDIYTISATIEVLPNLSYIDCQVKYISIQTELGINEASNTISKLNIYVNNQLRI